MLEARMALVAQCSGMGATARQAPQHGLGVLGLLPPGRLQLRQPETGQRGQALCSPCDF